MSDTLRSRRSGTAVDATPTAGADGAVLRRAAGADVRVGQQRRHLEPRASAATADARPRQEAARSTSPSPTCASSSRAIAATSGGDVYGAVSRVVEVPEPLNEITQDFGVRAAYNFATGNVHAAFNRNLYDNDAETLIVDNPFQASDLAVRLDARPGRGRRRERPVDQRARQRGQHRHGRLPAQVRAADPHRRRRRAGHVDAERAVLPVHDQLGDPDAGRGQRRQPVGAPAAVVRRQDRHDDGEPHVLVAAGREPRPSARSYRSYDLANKTDRFVITGDVGGFAGPQLDRRDAQRGRAVRPRDGQRLRQQDDALHRVRPATTSARSRSRARSGSPASSGPAARPRRATTTATRSPRCYRANDWLDLRATYDEAKRTAEGETLYGFQADEAERETKRTGLQVDVTPVSDRRRCPSRTSAATSSTRTGRTGSP